MQCRLCVYAFWGEHIRIHILYGVEFCLNVRLHCISRFTFGTNCYNIVVDTTYGSFFFSFVVPILDVTKASGSRLIPLKIQQQFITGSLNALGFIQHLLFLRLHAVCYVWIYFAHVRIYTQYTNILPIYKFTLQS